MSGKCIFFKNMDSSDLALKLSDFLKNGTKDFLSVKKKKFERDRVVDEYMKMYGAL